MNKLTTRIFVIILGIVGVFLLFLVGANIVSVYRSSIGETNPEEEVRRNIDCSQIVFDVFFQSNDVLEITNTRLSSFNLDEIFLVDSIDGSEVKFSEYFFVPGRTRELDISNISFESFYVVPFGCNNIAKVCNVSEQRCYD